MDEQDVADLLRRGDVDDDPETVDASFIQNLRAELLSDLRSSSHRSTRLTNIDSGGSEVSAAIVVDFDPAVEPKRRIVGPLLVAASLIALVVLAAIVVQPDGDERVATQDSEDVDEAEDGRAAASNSTLVPPAVPSTSVPPAEACAALVEGTASFEAIQELDAEQATTALMMWVDEIDVLRERLDGTIDAETDDALLRVRARIRRLLDGPAPTFAELAQADADFRSATFGEAVLAECRR